MRLTPLILALVLAAPLHAQPREVPQSAAEIQLSFAPVVKQAVPSVVNIYASRVMNHRSPFEGDPFFERFFKGLIPGGRSVQNSLGSGVIVGEDGLVVTNHHVVGEATEIRVVLHDRREFQAEILLDDPDSDLVVLRLEGAKDLPALPLRDTSDLEVGDLVLAIGNPFGVGQTVTSGIVSALARTSGPADGGYFLQTDAAINPGNSGGALVDMAGRLVGINTSILSRSGGSIGIGFAVPADLVRQVVAQAEAGRSTLARPWSGVEGQPVDGQLAEALGMSVPQGLVLKRLHPSSPFAAAGLTRGDVLLAIDGRPVNSPAELSFRLAALGLGREATCEYLSGGKPRSASLRLTAPPETPPRETRRLPGPTPLGGLTVANLNPAVAEEVGASWDAQGVVVLAAEDQSARGGFRPGDLIVSANGREVSEPSDLDVLARSAPAAIELVIERDGKRGALRFRR